MCLITRLYASIDASTHPLCPCALLADHPPQNPEAVFPFPVSSDPSLLSYSLFDMLILSLGGWESLTYPWCMCLSVQNLCSGAQINVQTNRALLHFLLVTFLHIRSFLHAFALSLTHFSQFMLFLSLITSYVQFSEIQSFIYKICASYPVNVHP